MAIFSGESRPRICASSFPKLCYTREGPPALRAENELSKGAPIWAPRECKAFLYLKNLKKYVIIKKTAFLSRETQKKVGN